MNSHVGSIRLVNVMLFARSGDVMGASNHRLHPMETRIAGRADLLRTEFSYGNLQKPVASLVQQQFPVAIACANDFAFIALIDEIV